MKRAVLILSGVVLIAGALGLAARALVTTDEAPVPATAVPAAAAREAPDVFVRAATLAERGVTAGRIAGRVHRRGAAVNGATVLARSDTRVFAAKSGADGAFGLAGLSPGHYLVSASAEGEASAVLGPLLLAPGQSREALSLELLAAASVSGVVLDAVSRRPVPGALVRSSGGEVVSDAAGRFRLEALPAGETWVEASAAGYLGRVEWLTIEAAREHSGMELYLRPAGRLRGQVTRAGKPVAQATAWGEPLSPGAAVRLFGPVTTGADGAFELWATGGALQLAAAGPGGSRVEGPRLTLGEGASQEGLAIELGQELSAEGVVLFDGQPRPAVALYLLDGKTQKMVGATTSAGGGHFRFDGVAPGGYLVQAELGSRSAQRGPFDFTGEPGEGWTVEIDSGRALFGRVTPAAPGVIVRWRSSDWAGELTAQVSTDLQGAFRFEGVPEGLLTVEAEGEAGTAQARAAAGTEVVLALHRGTLRGVVVADKGQAVTDFTIRLQPLGGGSTRSYPVLSPTGDFRIEAPPGRYQVTATASGHGEAESPATVELGASEPFVKLTLLGAIEVRGLVRDAADGSPVEGVEVVFNRMGRDRRRWAGRWATVLTLGDGSFEVGAVPSDAVLAFRKRGYVPLWTALEPVPRDAGGRLLVSLRRGDPAGGVSYEPYEGIGAQLAESGGKVLVAFAFEGSPAEAAGLLPGDQIASVDGQPSAGLAMGELIRRIMGPAGTVVRLGVLRGEEPLEVQIRRRAIRF